MSTKKKIFILIICLLSLVFSAVEGTACNRVVKVRWNEGNTAEVIRTTISAAKENATIRFEKNKTYLVSWNDRHHLADLKEGITIDGNGATIKIADGTNTKDFTWGCLFRISRKNNITIKNLTIDFNGDNNPVLQKLKNVYWERNGLTVAEFADGLNINNCKLIGQRGDNDITIFASNGVEVHHCTFINSGQVSPTSYIADHSSLLVLSCKNAEIYNNRIVNDSLRTIGTGYDLGLVDSYVHDNYVENAHYGMILSANNACKNVVVRNNEFKDNTYAMVIWSYGKTETYSEGSIVENVVIERNRFYWAARNGQYYCRGINMKSHTEGTTRYIRIVNNTFESDIDAKTINLEKSFEYAIYLGAAPNAVKTELAKVENVTIKGNRFNTIMGPAIRLSDKAYKTVIINNSFVDCSCTGFPGFDGSIIVAAAESGYALSDLKVENNKFYNNKYQNGKHGIALYNSLSDVRVTKNRIKLTTAEQLLVEPRIQKEHELRKDIIVR